MSIFEDYNHGGRVWIAYCIIFTRILYKYFTFFCILFSKFATSYIQMNFSNRQKVLLRNWESIDHKGVSALIRLQHWHFNLFLQLVFIKI